jgi:MFS family permease
MGFTAMASGTTVGVMASMSIVGQLTCGVLGLRVKGKYLATACLISLIIGITTLMNARILPLIYLHTVLSGFGYGGLLMLQPVIIAAYYGRTHYARIIGWTIPVTTVFSSISPVLAGIIYDNSGSYNLAFILVLALLGIGLISSLLARPPKHSKITT